MVNFFVFHNAVVSDSYDVLACFGVTNKLVLQLEYIVQRMIRNITTVSVLLYNISD